MIDDDITEDDPFVASLTHLSRYKWFYAVGLAFIAMLTLLRPSPKSAISAPPQLGSAATNAAAGAPAASTEPATGTDLGPLASGYPDTSGALGDLATTTPPPDESPPPSESPPPAPPAGYTCATDASLPAPALSTVLNALASIQAAVAGATGQAPPDATAAVAAALGCTGAPAAITSMPPDVLRGLVGLAFLGL